MSLLIQLCLLYSFNLLSIILTFVSIDIVRHISNNPNDKINICMSNEVNFCILLFLYFQNIKMYIVSYALCNIILSCSILNISNKQNIISNAIYVKLMSLTASIAYIIIDNCAIKFIKHIPRSIV